MPAGPSPASVVQGCPVPGRLADHLDGDSAPVKEISLKNNGEQVMGGAPNGCQRVVLACQMSQVSFALGGILCGSVSHDSSLSRKEFVEHGRLLS
jgi:hypothetical protein